MRFIVIEGDNGTGKDTLAIKLQESFGFRIITNEEDIINLNKEAKKYDGIKKIEKFLEYGKICSEKVRHSNQDIILVRYWISTLASAYADNICTYQETCKLRHNICSTFCEPDTIICLWCDFATRLNRIKTRKTLDFDDITIERNNKYKWFLNKMESTTNIKWINIDTTVKTKEEVFEETFRYLM